MYTQFPTDYELAVERSLNPATDAEKRLADAYLALHELVRNNQENCVYCGSPHD